MATETGAVGGEPVEPAIEPSAEDLLVQVSKGNQDAFAEFYDLLAPRVFGLVCRLLIDRAQAEEVTQEVFLELWQSATSFDPNKGRASSWTMTIAHRRAIDRIRSAQAGRNRDLSIGIRDYWPDYDNVAEQVEVRLEHEKVVTAMQRLSEVQYQALCLAYYGGYTHSEIAERISVPVGTVKTRLRDGMIRLREELGVAS